MFYRIAEISILPKMKAGTTSEVYVAQVDAEKEMLAGQLFIIIEIDSREIEDVSIINFIIEDINKNYYYNDKVIFKEYKGLIKLDKLLEAALSKTNKNLLKFCEEQKIDLEEKSISVTVGVVHKDNLYFSTNGKNRAFLFLKSKNASDQKFKMIDILKQTPEEDQIPDNPLVIFSNIISGSLPKNGYCLFSNEALPEYISTGQLTRIITSLPPVSAVEQIKNQLDHINAYVTFLGVIIKNTSGEVAERTQAIKPSYSSSHSSSASIVNLNNTERLTERFLSPSGMVNMRKIVNVVSSLILNKGKRIGPEANRMLMLGERIILKRRAGLAYARRFLSIFQNSFYSLINIIGFYGKKILKSRSKEQEKALPKEKNSISRTLKSVPAWFLKLKFSHKLYLAIFLVSLILFVQNIHSTSNKNKDLSDEHAYSQLIQNLEQKQNELESQLLYNNNEEDILRILDDFKKMIEQLPRKTAAQTEQYAKYLKKYEEQSDVVNRVVRISGPKALFDASGLNIDAAIDRFVKRNDIYYFSDQKNSLIYKFDAKNNLKSVIPLLTIKDQMRSPLLDSDHIYYLGDNGLIDFDWKNETFSTTTLANASSTSSFIAMQSYGGRFYVLDKGGNQIWRYRQTYNGFSSPGEWLKTEADFSKVVDMYIDGRIYLAQNNGTVLKYFSGAKDEFKLSKVSPPLDLITRIQASQDLDFLYVLDPKNKRLLVFKKTTGSFLKQYLFSEFSDLKDFFVSTDDKTIYILNKSSFYKIPSQHLTEK